jgi:hypothetical protein
LGLFSELNSCVFSEIRLLFLLLLFRDFLEENEFSRSEKSIFREESESCRFNLMFF